MNSILNLFSCFGGGSSSSSERELTELELRVLEIRLELEEFEQEKIQNKIEEKKLRLKIFNQKFENNTVTVDGCTDDECPICQENFCENENENKIIKLDCGHHFHKNCMQTWFITSPTCPMCRLILL